MMMAAASPALAQGPASVLGEGASRAAAAAGLFRATGHAATDATNWLAGARRVRAAFEDRVNAWENATLQSLRAEQATVRAALSDARRTLEACEAACADLEAQQRRGANGTELSPDARVREAWAAAALALKRQADAERHAVAGLLQTSVVSSAR